MAMWWHSKIEEDPIVPLKDQLEDAAFRSLQTQSHTFQGMKPGRAYYMDGVMHDTRFPIEDCYVYGPCFVAWVCNRSGGTLAQGALTKWYTKTGITATGGSTSTVVCAAATFTADEEVHNMVYCLDNNDAAGAAPEGENRYITKNTATTLTVQPNWSVAVANADTFEIVSRTQIVAAAAGDDKEQVAGLVLRPNGISDNYWGWVLVSGIGPALVKAATAITKGQRLIADAGRLDAAAGGGVNYFEDLGYALCGCSADISSDLIPVNFRPIL